MTEYVFDQMRRAMVASQLRTTGVSDPRVVAAMGAVPRERFVPEGRGPLAYADTSVPLGGGRELNSPMALGLLLSEARPAANDRALIVGAATGYSAAVLARLVASVVAVEEDPALVAAAGKGLAGLGNVTLAEGSLVKGYKKGAPYDLVLVDGAIEFVPQPLIDQLADGGRLAAAMLENGVTSLAVGRKVGDGFAMVKFSDAAASILPGFTRPRAFTF